MTRQGAFTVMFWGFIFILFDFFIQGINIFPNSIGYLLVSVAARRLSQEHREFQTVYWVSIPLILLSIPNLYKAPTQQSSVSVNGSLGNPLLTLLWVVSWVLSLILVYHLCRGIAEMARDNGLPDLASQSTARWLMFLWMQIGTAVVMLLGVSRLAIALPLVILLFIYSIVVLIAFLTWLWRCRASL